MYSVINYNTNILSQTSRTESPDMVCIRRTKTVALQQITAQCTESERVEKRKAVGLREDDNPLLSTLIHTC